MGRSEKGRGQFLDDGVALCVNLWSKVNTVVVGWSSISGVFDVATLKGKKDGGVGFPCIRQNIKIDFLLQNKEKFKSPFRGASITTMS